MKWEKEGAHDAWMRARDIVNRILSAEEVSYISDENDKAIRRQFNILL